MINIVLHDSIELLDPFSVTGKTIKKGDFNYYNILVNSETFSLILSVK